MKAKSVLVGWSAMQRTCDADRVSRGGCVCGEKRGRVVKRATTDKISNKCGKALQDEVCEESVIRSA